MAPRLSHVSAGHVRGFYESSFRQLSDIQQRQAGLLLGAAIGDAAARPLRGLSNDALHAHIHATGAAVSPGTHGDVAFMRVPETTTQWTGESPPAPTGTTASLSSCGFSYALFADSVRAMSAAGGDFGLPFIQRRWVETAEAVSLDTFAVHHGRLLHTLLAVLPFPVLYPYASDHVLRRHCDPFIAFLTSTGAGRTPGAVRVRDYTFSSLGVVLRYLQSNPDATRNAAFMAVAGTTSLFPDDARPVCPTATSGGAGRASTGPDSTTASPQWLCDEVEVVRQGLCIARESTRFTDGVRKAILLGGPHITQRATLVGAMLGARLGVRQLPTEWLNATPDHRTIATQAIAIAQHTWNPSHH